MDVFWKLHSGLHLLTRRQSDTRLAIWNRQRLQMPPPHSSSNALAGPSTSTPAGVKRPTQSRPTSSRNTRSRKRHRAMPNGANLAGGKDHGSDSRNGSSDSQSDGVIEFLTNWIKRSLKFARPEDIVPVQPSTSSSKSGGRAIPRDQQSETPNHDDPATFDMTHEPDEDMLFLASPRRPDFTTSTSSFSSTEGGSRRRREPMYNEVSDLPYGCIQSLN